MWSKHYCRKKYELIGDFMLSRNKIIAAVRSKEDLVKASSSDAKIIFDLSPNILTLEENLKIAH